MSAHRSQEARYERLKAVYHADLPALTVLLARRYLADYPDHWPIWGVLGSALIDLHRYDEAEQALSEALGRCPADQRFMPLSFMGRLYARQGDLERAAEWFKKMIEAAPRDNSGYDYLGITLSSQGSLHEAEEILRNAIETCDEGCTDEVFLHLGHVLRAQERFEEAAECFREAIHLDPEYHLAHRALRDVEQCMKIVKNRS